MTTDIHVTRWGAGTDVLMVHGAAQGSPAGGEHQFAAQQRLAERGWRLVLPDRPGHGRSPSRGDEDLELEAEWVAAMLFEGAHLVGHSYGAAIALCAAGLRPDAVLSLTLIEAPIFSLVPDQPDVQALQASIASAMTKDDPVAVMVAFSQAAGIPVELLQPVPTLEQLGQMGEGLRAMRPPHTWDASNAASTVASAGIPALVVTGGWNAGFEAVAEELARRLHAQHLVIDAGHHFPHIATNGPESAPGEQFNTALEAFLNAHQDRRPSAAATNTSRDPQ
jgi:pimeloyl-ACP methyl ester carboxylesterase